MVLGKSSAHLILFIVKPEIGATFEIFRISSYHFYADLNITKRSATSDM